MIYEQRSSSSKLILIWQLFNVKMRETKPTTFHVNTFSRVLTKLSSQGRNFEEDNSHQLATKLFRFEPVIGRQPNSCCQIIAMRSPFIRRLVDRSDIVQCTRCTNVVGRFGRHLSCDPTQRMVFGLFDRCWLDPTRKWGGVQNHWTRRNTHSTAKWKFDQPAPSLTRTGSEEEAYLYQHAS